MLYTFYDISRPSSWNEVFSLLMVSKFRNWLRYKRWAKNCDSLLEYCPQAPGHDLLHFFWIYKPSSILVCCPSIMLLGTPYSVPHLPIFRGSGPLIHGHSFLALIKTVAPGYIVKKAKLLTQYRRKAEGRKEGRNTKRKPLHCFQAWVWTMFRLRGFERIWGFEICQVWQPSLLHRVSFQSSISDLGVADLPGLHGS